MPIKQVMPRGLACQKPISFDNFWSFLKGPTQGPLRLSSESRTQTFQPQQYTVCLSPLYQISFNCYT